MNTPESEGQRIQAVVAAHATEFDLAGETLTGEDSAELEFDDDLARFVADAAPRFNRSLLAALIGAVLLAAAAVVGASLLGLWVLVVVAGSAAFSVLVVELMLRLGDRPGW